MKAPGRKPRPLQGLRHDQLRDLGFRVFVVDSAERIPEIVEEMKEGAIMSIGRRAIANAL